MKDLQRIALLILLLWAALSSPAAVAQNRAAQRPGQFAFLGYQATVPEAWEPLPPASSMRAAQYRIPGAANGADGELVVFYFGKDQGGSVQANVERWVSQFTTADGKPVTPKLAKLTVAGLPVTMVELNGNYARGVGMGPQGAAKSDQTLLVAVIETPEGNITIQMHGDSQTVAAHRKGFEAMVRGFGKRA